MMPQKLRIELAHMAPLWQPRGMAIICFAAAGMLVWNTIFPVVDEMDTARRMIAAGITLAAGVAYWTLAPFFRVWMVHLVVTIGFLWGFAGLARAASTTEASLAVISLLWTAVFVGAAFRPSFARAYEVLVCIGMIVGMGLNGVQGGPATGFAFAASSVVIMEILSRTTSQLRREATTDRLTGLLNRSGLERAVRRVRSFGRDDRIAVLVVDLDGFKAVNDSGGHRAGDDLLKRFAKAWREGARRGDLIARVGGDEFAVVFPERDEEVAAATVERLRDISPAPWSGGLVISEPGEPLESCMARADRLLYEEKAAKRAGRPSRPGQQPAPAGLSPR